MGPRKGCCCAGDVPQDNISATHHAKDLSSLPFGARPYHPGCPSARLEPAAVPQGRWD